MVNGVISVILAAILAFSSYTTPSETVETTYIEPQEGVYRIGINQLVSHPALDAATNGFKDVLTEKLGDKVVFDLRIADGSFYNSKQISSDFVKAEYDLIMANATPSLQTAAGATFTTPILGTSITEYGTSLACEVVDGVVPGNISGTSDLVPFGKQVEVLTELFPNAKKVALLYCSNEAYSKFQVDEMAALLSSKSIETKEFTFASSDDLSAAAKEACAYADVIYLPTDNTVAAHASVIDGICRPLKKPVITGEEGTCSSCGVATLSIDYYRLGRVTGEMAYRILAEGEDISTMPIEYDENCTKMYNASIAEELGITVPEDYIPIE